MPRPQTAVLTWDWREQPNLDELDRIVYNMTTSVRIHQVDTGSDQYAVVITTDDLDAEAVQVAYRDAMKADQR